MQAAGISTTSALSPTTTTRATTRGFGDLNSEDFFGLLIAELQNQDPLKPTDNQQMLSQMAAIRQMEQSTTLNRTLMSLAGEQRFGATAGLIGHYVSGTVKSNSGASVEVEGVVTGVTFDGKGGAILELHNGKKLPAENVDLVTLVENLPAEIRQRLGLDPSADGATGDTQGASGDAANPGAAPSGNSEPAPSAESARLIMPQKWAQSAAESVDSAGLLLQRLFSPSIGVSL